MDKLITLQQAYLYIYIHMYGTFPLLGTSPESGLWSLESGNRVLVGACPILPSSANSYEKGRQPCVSSALQGQGQDHKENEAFCECSPCKQKAKTSLGRSPAS